MAIADVMIMNRAVIKANALRGIADLAMAGRVFARKSDDSWVSLQHFVKKGTTEAKMAVMTCRKWAKVDEAG